MGTRDYLKDKRRIVVKVGSSSLMHTETGKLNLEKMEKLVRVLANISNSGKDVILVSSGAIAVGRTTIGLNEPSHDKAVKQACASIGQARLMMVYQRLFAEYGCIASQILMTKNTMVNDGSRKNARNTFNELMKLKAIPIVNENDTVATDEIEFGDNDTLSAIVAALVGADLLILLSDIDGLYTDNPRTNPDAQFIDTVDRLTDEIMSMAKGAGSSVGTGGMATKLAAARIATDSGADMVIANSEGFDIVSSIMNGENVGTLFKAHKDPNFHLIDYLTGN